MFDETLDTDGCTDHDSVAFLFNGIVQSAAEIGAIEFSMHHVGSQTPPRFAEAFFEFSCNHVFL